MQIHVNNGTLQNIQQSGQFRRLQEVRTAEVYWVWNCGITSDPPFFLNCFYSNYFHSVIRFLNSAEILVKVG